MSLVISPKAQKQLSNLPKAIQKKAKRQFNLLLSNYRHPSLRARKMQGIGVFEGRIDVKYRFTFFMEIQEIHILTIGPHDEGLGKK